MPLAEPQGLTEGNKAKDRAVAEVLLRCFIQEHMPETDEASITVTRIDAKILAQVQACAGAKRAAKRKAGT